MGVGQRVAIRPKIAARLADPERLFELSTAKAWGYGIEEWEALPDEKRDELLEYERQICPRCGNLRSVCSNPDVPWYPQRSMCYATGARELTLRRLHKKHKDPGTDAMAPTDGMTVWMSRDDLSPDDEFV
ncbi:MAG: hypothetical protein QM714_00225 [Nocardioides sp.]|uniref:hypothetical protein n=1 Tax=Nocardioides sp. TaxID=35761 RepID=UPI0039E5D335